MYKSRRAFSKVMSGAALAAPMITKAYASSDTSYRSEIVEGSQYLRERAADQLALTRMLSVALESGDPVAAQLAYEQARPPYEEIEVHAWAFVDIDADIDARPYAFSGGETKQNFRGFHRIEALLYRDQDLAAALSYAKETEASVIRLQTALEQVDRFDAAGVLRGLAALPDEVAAKKISV